MIRTANTTTTTALLEGLRDPSNETVWRGFDARYRGVLVAFARRLGLNDSEASEVAQETLTRFLEEYSAGKFDRSRGRLRSWLIGIARYRIADVKRVRARRREHHGESVLLELPNKRRLTEIWDAELDQAILCEAMTDLGSSGRFKPQTLQAFRRMVVDQVSPRKVAEELDLTLQAVYMAKHHCLGKLKELVANLKAAYEVE
ncbi:MAG: sigma-70 family RNA polymerase sigma factor [Phycisphaerales bacterium]|nr:sigma-70 family RNA polymerase sigma factor [Phycisphaerales bacterium]